MNEMLHEAKHYGFRPFSTSLDWSILKEARDSYITRLNGIYANNLKNSGITLIDGKVWHMPTMNYVPCTLSHD